MIAETVKDKPEYEMYILYKVYIRDPLTRPPLEPTKGDLNSGTVCISSDLKMDWSKLWI